jgi:hypothetical protein
MRPIEELRKDCPDLFIPPPWDAMQTLNIPDSWRDVEIACELRHLPKMLRWMRLWEEAGRPKPERLTILSGSRVGVGGTLYLEARRVVSARVVIGRHLLNERQVDAANFDLFTSAAEGVMHALDSRSGEAPPLG